MKTRNAAASSLRKLLLLIASMGAAMAAVAPAQTNIYVGNSLNVPSGNSDSAPPLVILGQYNPGGPPTTSPITLPSGMVQDVQFYGGDYDFTLYALSLVASGPNPNEQTFQVVASQNFSGSASVGIQTLPVTNFVVAAGDLLAFAGTGPYYPNGVPGDATNSDATYGDASSGSFTATPPGGPGTQFVVGLNSDTNATYGYVPDFFQNQGRTYGIGVHVQPVGTNGALYFANSLAGTDQVFRATLIGPATGSNYVIEMSTNLPVFNPLVAVASPPGSYNLADSNNAGLPRAFYRAYLTPANAGPPTIIVQPQDRTNHAGTTAAFSVATGGATPQSYEWTGNGGLLAGVTNVGGTETPILLVSNVSDADATFYAVTITNAGGAAISRQAQLTIIDPPMIMTGPDDRTNNVGTTTSFEVTASGTPPLTYQWFHQGQALSGETLPELILPGITASSEGTYSIMVGNSAGIASSNAVLDVPFLGTAFQTTNPYTTTTGSTVVLQTVGNGISPIFYQWRLNGAVIPGATNSTFVVDDVQATNGGLYYATIFNSQGAVDGDPIGLLFTNVTSLPSEDVFTNRGSLGSTFSGVGIGSNVGATLESGEPPPAHNPGGSSVWLSWTAPSNGIATFSTSGSGFDTLLAIYTGNVLATLAPIASDDDSGGFYTSEVAFNAKAGVTYDIDIDGFFGAQGNYVLSWNLEATSDRLPRIVVQPVSQTVAGGSDVNLFVVVTNVPVIYQWRRNGFDLPGATDSNLDISFINADIVGEYQVAVTDTNDITPRTVVSEAADVQIGSEDTGLNTAVLAVDKFENAIYGAAGPVPGAKPEPLGGSLSGGYTASQVFGSVTSMTQYKEPNHCGIACSGSRWFAYQPPCSGQLMINDFGSTADQVLAVYTCPPTGACALSNLLQVACAPNNGSSDETVNFTVAKGTIYYICLATPVNGSPPGTAVINYALAVNGPTIAVAGPTGTVTHNHSAIFTAGLSGTSAGVTYTYQWQVTTSTNNNVPIFSNVASGGTAATYTISSTPISSNKKQYRVVVTDSCGTQPYTSSPVTLLVQ